MTSYREAIVFRLFSVPFLFSSFSFSFSLPLIFFHFPPANRTLAVTRDQRYKSCTNFAWRSVMLFARAPLVRVSCSWTKRFDRSLWVLESSRYRFCISIHHPCRFLNTVDRRPFEFRSLWLIETPSASEIVKIDSETETLSLNIGQTVASRRYFLTMRFICITTRN